MRKLAFSVLALTLAAVVTAPPVRAGVPRPGLDLAAGATFRATGDPGGGGLSLSISPLWATGDRTRFGIMLFADDIGTDIVHLLDANDGADLGAVAASHRWAWGAAWRGEADVLARGPWTASATGAWGAWRVEDDRRGVTTAAATAVGFMLGGDVRRSLSSGKAIGLAVRYHRPFPDHQVAFSRVDRYASAAIEWRWATRGER